MRGLRRGVEPRIGPDVDVTERMEPTAIG